MNKKIYNKLFKILISNLFILFFLINQNAISKPIPPGSGAGDVPANILILLDSSASMNKRAGGGDGIDHPHSMAVDSNGNIYVGEGKLGVMKFLPDKTADNTFANGKRNYMGYKKDGNCNNANTLMTDIHSMGITSDDIIYAMAGNNNGKVVGFNTAGECVDGKIMYYQFKFRPRAMTVKTITHSVRGAEDHMWIVGRWWLPKNAKKKKGGKWNRFMYTKNLSTGATRYCINKNTNTNHSLANVIENTDTIAVDKLGKYIYSLWSGHIYGYPMDYVGENICPTSSDWTQRFLNTQYVSGGYKYAKRIATSADDEDIIYITTHSHLIQKIEITTCGKEYYGCPNSSATSTELYDVTVAGRNSTASLKDETAGAIAASLVSLKKPTALAVTSSGVYVGTSTNTIQEFDEDKFTDASKDTSWQKQYGGAKTTRYEGAKEAIRAIVSDSALTSGANFGYGHWNSGEIGSGKKNNPGKRGGWECHGVYDDCEYYVGWTGDHPEGTSTRCNSDSCLLVGISDNSADEIPDALDKYDLEWGTDGNSFAQMASKYFREKSKTRPDKYMLVDPGSDCQLNYVIVIGDGAQKHHAEALAIIKDLRTDLGVKTIVVAYGGGITGTPLTQFKELAVAGSCDVEGTAPCHDLIVASTPAKLKTELQSKIRQIVAERLSFTAPAITATIQEGGSIYQAQFNYEQHGEWQGTILKKSVDTKGNVDHEITSAGNWDAGLLLKEKGADSRKIWTVLRTTNYFGDWNNWMPGADGSGNSTEINKLFELTGVEVADYHNTESSCYSINKDLLDETGDDIDGLISFVRGKDYFDYNGNCDITEDRDWLLGDIYHSQLVDVGAPNAKTEFTNINQEAYWRRINNYSSYRRDNSSRNRVLYAGANDGMLHAFDSDTGEELWGFVPPFIAAKLPVIVQTDLDGAVGVQNGGGTNPIFAVDGSPVIHDMYIRGLSINDKGTKYEGLPSWRTILIIPYGRGGPGFSVLDVTHPLITTSQGPMHMFSIFNDMDNNRVLVADHTGVISEHSYPSASITLSQSREAKMAIANQTTARDSDGEECDSEDDDTTNDCTQQDNIQACKTHTESGGNFGSLGTAACFRGKKFTWTGVDLKPIDDDGNLDTDSLKITETVSGDTRKEVPIDSAKMVGGFLEITFSAQKTYSKAASYLVEDTRQSNKIKIETSCGSKGTADKKYDYSQLGETWSTPRIFRIPKATGNADLGEDTYVAVMGGGMGVNTLCVGSNLFIVDLERGEEAPGALFTNGPLRIVDTDPSGIKEGDATIDTANGSDISNATPATPIVITPDNVRGIPWRGAMVYINDLEGKITKFNLTSSTRNNAKLFDQTTLYSLNANKTNGRYSFHSMDVTMGTDTNNLWLFGSTGNYNKLSSTGNKEGDWMQNILYGIRDGSFPYFRHQQGAPLPDNNDSTFLKEAAVQANKAPNIDNNNNYTKAPGAPQTCKDTTGIDNACLVKHNDDAWVIYLDQPDGRALGGSPDTVNTFRKASAAPTVFKGYVYFPIYQPDKDDSCGLGKAFICSAEDECGKNVAGKIKGEDLPEGENCLYIKRGILSKLEVGLGNRLFGNVAGPTENEQTLMQILSSSTDVSSYRRSWRENY